MLTAIIFIIILGVLVLVHEFGHFITAKRAGMKVEEFGFGFPPKIFGIKRGETTYSINWVPFGGFVKIFGENGEEKNDPRSFASAKAGVRSWVIVAGVIMNFLLAIALLSVDNAVGLRVGLDEASRSKATDIKIQILEVAPKSPAELAGIKPLDEIVRLKIGSKDFTAKTTDEVQGFINQNRGHEVVIETRRGANIIDSKVIPRANPPTGEGALGISLAITGIIKYPWYQAIYHGAFDSAIILERTFVGYGTIIGNLFTTGKAGVQLSGPIGIAIVTGQAAGLGFAYLMQFIALLSINLAVLNILPFPALDGGRLLFIIIEKIKGSPINKKIENAVNTIGFALLIILMIYVTTKDILKFF